MSISRIILAVVVAVFVGIVFVAFLGPALVTLKAPIAVSIGNGLIDWGWVLGVVAGLWFYFSGASFPGFGPRA